MTGVHCALEMARLGFDVTVFDTQKEIAGCRGATAFSRPFVGLGMKTPFILNLSLPYELALGMMPLGCPNIYSCDEPHRTFFSRAIHKWMFIRRQPMYSSQRAVELNCQLAEESATIVSNLTLKYPSLKQHVMPLTEYADLAAASPGTAPFSPCAANAMFLSPVKWCRELADILQREYYVKFRLGTEVSALFSVYRGGEDFIRGLSYTDHNTEPPSLFRENFDVVVVAAGHESLKLAEQVNADNLRMLGLRGFGMTLPNDHQLVRSLSDKAQFQCPKQLVTSSGGESIPRRWFANLVDSCGLAMYADPNFPDDRTVVSGLLSFDTSRKVSPVKSVFNRVTSTLRVRSSIDTPPLDSSSDIAAWNYTRSFAPDGVPIVSHLGTLFNGFIVGGLGDQIVDQSPAAARMLSDLVLRSKPVSVPLEDREVVALNPFSLARFHGGYKPIQPAQRTWLEKFTIDIETDLYHRGHARYMQFTQFLAELARTDGAPMWFRNMVFDYFYSEADEEDMKQFYAELRAVAEKSKERHSK